MYTLEEADICIPRNKINQAIENAEKIGTKHGVLLVPVGHAGDGNLHFNIIKLQDTPEKEWSYKMESALNDLIDLSLGFDGTISGEHGIGYTKKHYLEKQIGAKQIELMRGIKNTFDPNHIMNPGKIFP